MREVTALQDLYTFGDRLYEGKARIVRRARSAQSGARVIVKQIRADVAAADDLRRIRHERDMLASVDHPNVARLVDYREEGVDAWLVLDDVGGESLARRLARGRLTLREALHVGASVASALGAVHAQSIVHKDVGPNNVALAPGGRVQLFDFDIAARLPRSASGLPPSREVEGTLPYISPEQTGRVSAPLDERSDLYSLGCMLYELVAGHPPFQGDDALEVMHAHLALRPAPLHEVDPAVPRVVSAIVMAMLEKSPDDRYQSAFGVERDLRACLDALARDGAIAPFPIAQHDVPARLHPPRRLYGRDADVEGLLGAFSACRDGAPSLTVIAGAAGTGKSELLRSITRGVAAMQGFVGLGKLEAEQPPAPYAALLEPLRALAQQIFGAGEGEIAAVQARAARMVRGDVGPLLALVPELSAVLGPGKEDRAGAPELSREQMRALFADLVQAFARPERPVALVLDDAQWADAASLDLLLSLVQRRDIRGLCLVVTARDDALAPGGTIAALLESVRREGGAPRVLELAALEPAALDALVADTLALPAARAAELAALVWPKTNGNALSVGMFLSSLYHDGLLSFDARAGCWTWDAAAIEALPVADNVVALLAERSAALGPQVTRALGAAACLGGRFDAAQVAAASGMPEDDARAALEVAVREGLLVPAAAGFRFAHDRVLEVAYQAVSAEDRRAFHREACRALRAGIERPESDAGVFDVLRHADAAGDAFDREERLALARLGLVAGRRARMSATFEVARALLTAAIARLPGDAWTSAPDLAWDLHYAAADSMYADARTGEGDRMFQVLLARAPSDEERASAWAMRALHSVGARRLEEALSHVRTGAALLGMRMPEEATTPMILYELARASRAIGGRSAEELAALPPLSSPQARARLFVIRAGHTAAYYHDRKLFTWMALRGVATLAEHGNSADAGGFYALYGMVLGTVLGDHARMAEMGKLALTLAEKYPNHAGASVAWAMNGLFVQHYRDHVRTALPLVEEGLREGLLAGHTNYAGAASLAVGSLPFKAGMPLEDALARCEEQIRVSAGIHAVEHSSSLKLVRQTILALAGRTSAPGSLATDDFDPEAHRAYTDRSLSNRARLLNRFYTAMTLVHFDRPRDALAELDRMQGTVEREWACLYELGEYSFLRALALSALVAGGGLGLVERGRHLLGLRLAVRKLAGWAERSPWNFSHRHALASAELCALTGDADAALRRYEEAIRGALRGGFLQDLGVAYERAGRFFLERNMVDVAVTYLASAKHSHERWGAAGKVALLTRRFPGLTTQQVPGDGTTVIGLAARRAASGSVTTNSTGSALDAPSLLKATQALSGERTMGRLFARMMEIVAESAGANRAALLLVTGDRAAPRIELHAQVAAGERPVLFAVPRPLEEVGAVPAGIVGWAVRTGERVLLRDASSEGPFTTDPYVVARRSRSILVLPLQWQGETLGALALENELVAGAFTEKRVSVLATLCAQLAISIQNARYYAELELKVDERTRALREAQSRIVALEKDATEAQMAGGFAHEMRNALSGAQMLLRVALGASTLPGGGLSSETSRWLREIYLTASPALSGDQLEALRAQVRSLNDVHRQLDDLLRRVEEAVARGLGITAEVTSYAALRRQVRGEQAVMLRPALEALARDLAAPGVRIEVDVPPDAAIRCKPEHLRSILENVVRNACDAVTGAAPERGGLVRITATATPAEVTVRIEDDGPGIPSDLLPRIFEPFFSTKPTTGIGLGLGVVQKLVSLYDGRITVDSAVSQGARFAITLPAAPLARSAPAREETAG